MQPSLPFLPSCSNLLPDTTYCYPHKKMKPKRGPRRRNNFLKDVTIKSSIVNDDIVHRNVRARTKDDYDRQLENWDDLLVSHLAFIHSQSDCGTALNGGDLISRRRD